MTLLDKMRKKQGLPIPPKAPPKKRAVTTQKPQPKAEAKAPEPTKPKFRLPDGCKYEAAYKATDPHHGTWKVVLTIGEQVFQREGSALHTTIMKLGQQYNKAQETQDELKR